MNRIEISKNGILKTGTFSKLDDSCEKFRNMFFMP